MASFVEPGRRGRGLGALGLAIAAPQFILVPVAPWLAELAGFGLVFVLASPPGARHTAGLADRAVAIDERERVPDTASGAACGGPGAAALWRILAWPIAALVVITASGGAILTFTPRILLSPALGFAGLLAFTGAGAVSRWGAGGIADRFGATTAIAPLLFIAALGLAAIGLRADSVHDTAGRTLLVSGLLLVGLAYGGLQNLTLTHAFAIAGEPARQSVSIAWNLSFDAGTGLGAFVVGAIATATSYSVAFGVLALAAVLTGGGWAWPGLARRGLPGRECAGHCDVGHRAGPGLSQSVIQPVITDAPSVVRNRSRNGPGGMGPGGRTRLRPPARWSAGPGMRLQRPGLRVDDLAEQGAACHLELDGQVG